MPLHKIDHVTLNCADLKKTIAFYGELGFTAEEHQVSGFAVAWLHLNGHPWVHVLERRADQPAESIGRIDHFALEATDVPEVRARLTKAGISFREGDIAKFNVHQIFVMDPDGVRVELNFRNHAAA